MPRHLEILKIEYGVNMAETRAYRDRGICRRLKEGQCILAFNMRENIMRLWDVYGMYTMYAPDGEIFDVPTIETWLKNGIGVVLDDLAQKDTREWEEVPARKVA